MARARAGFILRGESLSAWSAREGLKRQNVAAALNGRWRGAKAQEIIRKVFAYLRAKDVAG
ncbi:hypothetical protein [Salinarimonas chemoclinalis]|uniref:hypothetical protein n=1 Tax=Salinarimonas chemoclinalis TaxID=3241599 RepID=UPI003556CB13